jgi:thiamine transport system substrate-binding protein
LGTDWEQYWQDLKANDVLVTGGWEDAYFVEFSGSSGAGDYPIVLSYASSPSAEIRENGVSGTAALLENCFRQVEYAGVLTNAKNPEGAQALVEFLLSEEFQIAVPELMYVYPVTDVELPAAWSEFAVPAVSTVELPDLNTRRDEIVSGWSAIFD